MFSRIVGTLAALAAPLVAEAQTAAEAAATAATSNEAILLTPFQVSTDKDRGYFGGSTLAGGRADTPLRITPASNEYPQNVGPANGAWCQMPPGPTMKISLLHGDHTSVGTQEVLGE